ncbi:MAG TPA: right-handed parallel beta-helix repeat-containing protein [Pyrinomonadaceae bacterium]|nr:right-handed parallel beta-helix repeat-containing protein [Pyrinomonadaceae bacterium]
MNKTRFTLTVLAMMAFSLFAVSTVEAQSRTWVSGVGDDMFPCSRTAPCKTFSGAISKTAVNGEINCLDPGAFGSVTITKSIQIDCHEVFAGTTHPAGNGVAIAFDSFAGTDTRKSVRLRNLNFSGVDTGLRGISITGAVGVTGTEVFIEDCRIDGSFGSPGNGIRDARSGGGLLSVSNTIIRNMAGAGIGTSPAAGAANLKIVINNVRVFNCANGAAFSTNNKVTIYDSIFSGNTGAGIFAEDNDGGGQTEVAVDHSVVTDNGTGFQTTLNSTIRVSNTTAMYNTSLFSGTVLSYGNNQAGGAAFSGPVSPS